MSDSKTTYALVVEAPGDLDALSATLFELGALGVEERDTTTLAKTSQLAAVGYFDTPLAAEHAKQKVGGTIEIITEDVWRDRWKDYFKPTQVGERLWVLPPWEVDSFPLPEGALPIVIDPGQAFGTGTHETTRLVLRELEQEVKAGASVLDLGCGSGILSIGALKLKSGPVLGLDIDDESMEASAENTERNGVGAMFQAERTALANLEDDLVFDLVLANIETRILVPIAQDIISRVADHGTLILSGILKDEEDTIRIAFSELNFIRQNGDGEWIAMVYAKA